MTFLKQPPAGPRDRSADGGDLDGLLKTFFRAQLPDPWPAWQPPEQSVASARRVQFPTGGRTLRVGRSVLAASVLLLLVGQLAVTRLASDAGSWPPADAGDGPAEATHRLSSGEPAPPRHPLPRSLGKREATQKRSGQ